MLCPICGQPNQCGLALVPDADKADAPCWCRNLTISPEVLAKVPADQRNLACICPRCAAAIPAEKSGD